MTDRIGKPAREREGKSPNKTRKKLKGGKFGTRGRYPVFGVLKFENILTFSKIKRNFLFDSFQDFFRYQHLFIIYLIWNIFSYYDEKGRVKRWI